MRGDSQLSLCDSPGFIGDVCAVAESFDAPFIGFELQVLQVQANLILEHGTLLFGQVDALVSQASVIGAVVLVAAELDAPGES